MCRSCFRRKPRARATLRTPRFLQFQKEGGSGSPRTGAGSSPLAKRPTETAIDDDRRSLSAHP